MGKTRDWFREGKEEDQGFGQEGKLVNKINPKSLLAFGIVVSSYFMHLMAQFNMQASLKAIIWPRIVMGLFKKEDLPILFQIREG